MLKNKGILNFGKLMFGNVGGQVIALALYPYIARFYSPEEFSRFGYMTSLTVILSVFATCQLHTALLNPKDESEAQDLIKIATTTVSISSVIVLLYFLFFNFDLWLVGIYLFVYSLFEILKMYYIRTQAYGVSSLSQVSFRLIANGGKVLPFFVNLKSFGLVLSEIMALAIVVAYGLKKSIFKFGFNVAVFKKYKYFPMFQSFTIAINLFLLDFPVLMWSEKFPKDQIGYFVMGQKLLIMPALVVSNSVQNATVHHLLESGKPLWHYFRLVSLLVVLGVLGSLASYAGGIDILALLLGRNWQGGKEVFILMSLLFSTKLILALVQASFVLKNEIKIPFIVRVAQMILLFMVTMNELDFLVALRSYVLIDIVTDLILTCWAGFLIKPPFTYKGKI